MKYDLYPYHYIPGIPGGSVILHCRGDTGEDWQLAV